VPGIAARREAHEGARYLSQILGQRVRQTRLLHDELSQEDVAERMERLGHATWTRQTLGQVENANRNVTVDELVSLAAALQTNVAHLLSPASPSDPYTHEPVDIGGPDPLGRTELASLFGFATVPHPQAYGYYEWPDMTFKVAEGWHEVLWEGAGDDQ
jgi:transcriptional regulator with XRE-family HTH domain